MNFCMGCNPENVVCTHYDGFEPEDACIYGGGEGCKFLAELKFCPYYEVCGNSQSRVCTNAAHHETYKVFCSVYKKRAKEGV